MLDLKAQLAAAGIVSAEQVKAFDEKEAKAKEAREAKAKQRQANQGKGGKDGRGKNPNQGQAKGRGKGGKGSTSVDELKAMGRGEAYDRIRKIVNHSRLDDKERTIPLPDDQTFNFVTASGSIGRLYLTAATVASLKSGKSGISSFMSNHGLSHCVLPKDVALELAEVFPLWLRHLRGHEPIVEVPEEPTEEVEAQAQAAEPSESSES
ncbi:MAG: DUF2058 domain-containing protein [Myxococcales bacterium]|nr:DUF2058 domain-containing protein [Myxococcales bacterium]